MKPSFPCTASRPNPISLLILLLPALLPGCHEPAPESQVTADDPIRQLAALISLQQLDSQSPKSVVAHMFKTCYWLAEASDGGVAPADALAAAQGSNDTGASALAQETATALIRNVEKLEQLGCLNVTGRESLRNGQAPIIQSGAHAGTTLSVRHTISASRVPDLASQVFNLEFTPDSSLTETSLEHQLEFARRWHWQGLLDDRDYAAVVYAFPSRGAGR